jgi:hypothetical protein
MERVLIARFVKVNVPQAGAQVLKDTRGVPITITRRPPLLLLKDKNP